MITTEEETGDSHTVVQPQKEDVQVILLSTTNRKLHKSLTYCSVDYSGESEDWGGRNRLVVIGISQPAKNHNLFQISGV